MDEVPADTPDETALLIAEVGLRELGWSSGHRERGGRDVEVQEPGNGEIVF